MRNKLFLFLTLFMIMSVAFTDYCHSSSPTTHTYMLYNNSQYMADICTHEDGFNKIQATVYPNFSGGSTSTSEPSEVIISIKKDYQKYYAGTEVCSREISDDDVIVIVTLSKDLECTYNITRK